MRNPLAKLHLDSNRADRDGWDAGTEHRARVTRLVAVRPIQGASRLCVLGAGNCNDVDLAALVACHREVHLVDLDAEALTLGVARQGLTDSSALHLHGGIDVTGMLDAMARWSPSTAIQKVDLAACAEEPSRRVRTVVPGPFDVVASTCLLGQLVRSLVQAVGEQHHRFQELVQALRIGHLRLFADLIAPGGIGILITDIVSSDAIPDLGSFADEALASVLAQPSVARKYFPGVNPSVLLAQLRNDPVLSSQLAEVDPLAPWRWDLGGRLHGVCAWRVRKKEA